jgi:DNA-binding transcriptional LysR family regulator
MVPSALTRVGNAQTIATGEAQEDPVDFRGLDLNLILLLEALIRDPNQTRVAKALRISQPTVSASLAKLRKALKDELIVKSGATYKTAPRLQSLGPAIRQVLTILQQEVVGSTAFDPSEDDRPFVMATSDVGEVFLLPSLIQTISAKAPRATIRSVVIKPIDLEAALGDGTVDLAVGYFPDLVQATIVQQTLCSHPFTCLARTNHPLIKSRMTVRQFLKMDHIVITHEGRSQELLENALIELKMRRRAAVTVPHFLSVPFLVATSDLIATVPKLIGQCFSLLSNIKMVPPPFETPIIEVKQFWHRRFHGDPRSIWFRGLLMSIFRNAQFKEPTLKALQRDCK